MTSPHQCAHARNLGSSNSSSSSSSTVANKVVTGQKTTSKPLPASKCPEPPAVVNAPEDSPEDGHAPANEVAERRGEEIDLRGKLQLTAHPNRRVLVTDPNRRVLSGTASGPLLLGGFGSQNRLARNLPAVEALMDIKASKAKATRHLRSLGTGDDKGGPCLLLLRMPVESARAGQPTLQRCAVDGVQSPDLVSTVHLHCAPPLTPPPRHVSWAAVGSTLNGALAIYSGTGGEQLRQVARVCARTPCLNGRCLAVI